MRKDHEIKVWVDSVTYLAVKYAASDDERSVSEWVRVLIRKAIESKAGEKMEGTV